MKEGWNPGLGLAVLRIVLGIIFIAHGWPKLTGGIEETATLLTALSVPVPEVMAWAIAVLEVGGGAFLLVGYLVVPAALLLAVHMTLGIFLVHLSNGFYVVGPGSGGLEFNLLLVAGLLAMVLVGPGHGTLQSRFQKDITLA